MDKVGRQVSSTFITWPWSDPDLNTGFRVSVMLPWVDQA